MLTSTPSSSRFVQALQATTAMPEVFNPWAQHDPAHDLGPQSPAQRCSHLQAYLEARVNKARLVLIGEAPGYQGCKFSGIAMTSERILLDAHPKVRKSHVFAAAASRTSAPSVYPKGAMEPTASIAWALLLECGLAPEEFVFWNAFPFHPHKPGQPLTNRAPSATELQSTKELLQHFLGLFPQGQVVAVGRVAQKTLAGLGVAAPCVRHPAMGGATQFRQEVQALLSAQRGAA